MKDATAKFFELPLEEKNKIRMPPDDFQGYGRAYAVTQGQTLDWSDALFLSIYPTQYRRPNLWPTAPEGFKYVSKLNLGKNGDYPMFQEI